MTHSFIRPLDSASTELMVFLTCCHGIAIDHVLFFFVSLYQVPIPMFPHYRIFECDSFYVWRIALRFVISLACAWTLQVRPLPEAHVLSVVTSVVLSVLVCTCSARWAINGIPRERTV